MSDQTRGAHHRRKSSTLRYVAPNERGEGICNNQYCCMGFCMTYTLIVLFIFLLYMIPQMMWLAKCEDHRTQTSIFTCGSPGSYVCFGIFPSLLLAAIGFWIAYRWYDTRKKIFKPINSKRGICIGWTIGMLIPILLTPNVYWWADIHQDLDQCNRTAFTPHKPFGWCDELKELDSWLIAAAVIEIPWGIILICLVWGIVSHKIQNPLVSAHKLTSWKKGDAVIIVKDGYEPVLAVVEFEGPVGDTWKLGLELKEARPYSSGQDHTKYFTHDVDRGWMMSFREAEIELNPVETWESDEEDELRPRNDGRPFLSGNVGAVIEAASDSEGDRLDDDDSPVNNNNNNGRGLPPPPPPAAYESLEVSGARPRVLDKKEFFHNLTSADCTGVLKATPDGWYVEIGGWEEHRERRWKDLFAHDYDRHPWVGEAVQRGRHWHSLYGKRDSEAVVAWVIHEDGNLPYAWLGTPRGRIDESKLVDDAQMYVNVTQIRREPALLADVPNEPLHDYDETQTWYSVEAIHVVVEFGSYFKSDGSIPFMEERPVVVAGHLAVLLSPEHIRRNQANRHLDQMWDDNDDEAAQLVSGGGGFSANRNERTV